MARTLSTIVTLTPEQNLMQLILIPYLLGLDRVLTNQARGTKGFGSLIKLIGFNKLMVKNLKD
jgi:hypothetical protein